MLLTKSSVKEVANHFGMNNISFIVFVVNLNYLFSLKLPNFLNQHTCTCKIDSILKIRIRILKKKSSQYFKYIAEYMSIDELQIY